MTLDELKHAIADFEKQMQVLHEELKGEAGVLEDIHKLRAHIDVLDVLDKDDEMIRKSLEKLKKRLEVKQWNKKQKEAEIRQISTIIENLQRRMNER